MKKSRTKQLPSYSEDYYENYRSKLRSNTSLLLKTPEKIKKPLQSPDKSPIREGNNKFFNQQSSTSKISNLFSTRKSIGKPQSQISTNPFSKMLSPISNTIQQPLNYLHNSNSIENYLTEYEAFLEKRRSYEYDYLNQESDNPTFTSSSDSCSVDSDNENICQENIPTQTNVKLTNLLREEPNTSESESETNNNTNSLEDSFNKTLDFMEADLDEEILRQLATPLNSQSKNNGNSQIINKNENFTFTPIKLPVNRCSKLQISQRTKRSSQQRIESPIAVNPLKSKLVGNERLVGSESCEKLRKIGENDQNLPKSQSVTSIQNQISPARRKCKLAQNNARKRCYPAESSISISKHLDFKKLKI